MFTDDESIWTTLTAVGELGAAASHKKRSRKRSHKVLITLREVISTQFFKTSILIASAKVVLEQDRIWTIWQHSFRYFTFDKNGALSFLSQDTTNGTILGPWVSNSQRKEPRKGSSDGEGGLSRTT